MIVVLLTTMHVCVNFCIVSLLCGIVCQWFLRFTNVESCKLDCFFLLFNIQFFTCWAFGFFFFSFHWKDCYKEHSCTVFLYPKAVLLRTRYLFIGSNMLWINAFVKYNKIALLEKWNKKDKMLRIFKIKNSLSNYCRTLSMFILNSCVYLVMDE